MGVVVKSVEVVTCDLCGRNCKKGDCIVSHEINGGDGRDVGPTTIQGTIGLYQPYGVYNGLLCRHCLHKHLSAYVNKLERLLDGGAK